MKGDLLTVDHVLRNSITIWQFVESRLICKNNVIHRDAKIEAALNVELEHLINRVWRHIFSYVGESPTISNNGQLYIRGSEKFRCSDSEQTMALSRCVTTPSGPKSIDDAFRD